MNEGEAMNDNTRPIGVFDSGLGGLSVLKEAIKLLPNENFIYLGDSKNAPYGVRTKEDVMNLTHESIKFLLKKKVKAIVIACNTATAAADELRKIYSKDLPILGIEPALKPAATSTKDGIIVVMATQRTLEEQKFFNLKEKYASDRNVISMPCPKLVTLVEEDKADDDETIEYLNEKFKDINKSELKAVVLGCTHFPFAKKAIKKVVGDVPLFDGSVGISKYLKQVLMENNLLNPSNEKGNVEIYNTLNQDMVELSKRMLKI